MVKFGLPVFYLFGLLVKNSAFWFSFYSAFRIWPSVPVRDKVSVNDNDAEKKESNAPSSQIITGRGRKKRGLSQKEVLFLS